MNTARLFVPMLLTLLISAVCPAPYAKAQEKSTSATKEILTPKPGPQPRINGPLVYGCRPGNPFLYRIPCQGERPIRFSALKLPAGLILDPATGIISGKSPSVGEYTVTLKAENSKGKATRSFRIVAGETLALTPPMGWNSWYVHYNRVSDKIMRGAADAMISSGMADVGYQYVNIDDCWMNAEKTNKYMSDSTRIGPLRDDRGNILPNRHFPDMKAMCDYIHSKGLKAGIYTSPGPSTCCNMAASWQHEEQDAAQFSEWGFDFLKYDWCSYGRLAGKEPPLAELKKPYAQMGEILKRQPRDIVYNLCQYGMGKVWEWGTEVGGHCWRTAGDLGFELDRFFAVALKNAEHGAWSGPGSWNDPDYIQIGWIGSQKNDSFSMQQPCLMSGDDQYSYMSLWCMMAAPLVFSGDMARLDDFTLNILCNPEIIDIDQDPLGKCGTVLYRPNDCFLMVKELHDGSKAVGFFNHGKEKRDLTVEWSELNISGQPSVRDLWRQKDLGVFPGNFRTTVNPQGVVMIRVSSR
jgi:alpha-galactosidase